MSPHPIVVVSVLKEAARKFGRITDDNRDLVALWVRKRCAELEQPEPTFDAKAAQAGDAKVYEGAHE